MAGLVRLLDGVMRTAATYQLQKPGWAGSAALKGSHRQKLLTFYKGKGFISDHKGVQGTAVTHSLQSQGWASSAGLKCVWKLVSCYCSIIMHQ
jgi:hypothetical protein